MTKTSRAKPKKANKPRKPAVSLWRKLNPFRWFFRHWGKLVLIFVLIIGTYGVYLDAQIRHTFAGNKWQVPAQIYARPMHLALKQEISIKEIEEELKLLGYRRVTRADSSGEYQILGQKIRIQRRMFDFPHGTEFLRNIEVTLNNERISKIQNLDSRRA
ncbi:MAG: penicillin-binding protein 1B, partial [Paraglaciecola sp.]